MAAKKEEPVLSAQVLLEPESGRELTGESAITTESLGQYQPSPEAAERVRERFSRAGFEVGPRVGISFSITAPASVFEKVFKTRIREAGKGDLELPKKELPRELAEDVAAVTFTPPPDFGPTNYD